MQYAYAELAIKCRKSSIWISQIHYYKFDISLFFFLVISLSYSRSRISTFRPNFSPRSRTDLDDKKIVESIDDATPSHTSQPVHQFSYNLKSGRNLREKLIWNVEMRVRGCEREKEGRYGIYNSGSGVLTYENRCYFSCIWLHNISKLQINWVWKLMEL